jgi:AraC-like DNA-binding protein
MEAKSTLATVWLMMLRLVEVHGIDTRQFLRELGVDAETVRDTQARLPSQLSDVAFEKAAALIPDPAFALRAAQCWHPSNLGVVGYAWLSSGTLRSGLKRLERFARTLGNRFTYRCVQEPAGLRFVYDHGRGDAPIGHLMTDFTLSIILDMCRTNFSGTLDPAAVTLRRPEPAEPQPYRDFFGCEIRFGALVDSFLLDSQVADTPLPSANQQLATTFDAILTEQLAVLDKDDIVTRCKAYLLRQLTSGEPSEKALSAALAMSRRTLQRKLGELGLTYKSVLDETRHALALRYLDDPTKTVTDITFLLGFSEQSVFTRAFKRWSGQAPTAYRWRQLPPA